MAQCHGVRKETQPRAGAGCQFVIILYLMLSPKCDAQKPVQLPHCSRTTASWKRCCGCPTSTCLHQGLAWWKSSISIDPTLCPGA